MYQKYSYTMQDNNANQILVPEDGNEIILYQPDSTLTLDVRVENETVWLNRNQIAVLFDRDVKTIGKHINNALQEELTDLPTVAKFAIVQKEGERTVTRNVEHYNLDVIISVQDVKSRSIRDKSIWISAGTYTVTFYGL